MEKRKCREDIEVFKKKVDNLINENKKLSIEKENAEKFIKPIDKVGK